MGGHNQGDRRKLNMNEGIASKTLVILALLTVLAQSAVINTSDGQEDVEDTRSIDEPDQKRGDDHFLRFAKKSYDNDFDDIFSKRGGDDHFLRFAKRDNADHFLRFAKPDDHFLRFAKADDHFLRFAKPDDHFLRFAKPDDHFLRFAKSNDDHMLRFSKK